MLKLIKNRRSVRVFTGKKVPPEAIKTLIEAGVWAPSGCNNQELRFLVVNPELIIPYKKYIRGASNFILVFADMGLEGSKMYNVEHEAHLKYIDVGLALQNMVLQAESLGLNTCICNLSNYHVPMGKSFSRKVLNRTLAFLGLHFLIKDCFGNVLKKLVDSRYEILCGVAVGYGKIIPKLEWAMHEGKMIDRGKTEDYIL